MTSVGPHWTFGLQLAAELAEALTEEEIEEGMKTMDPSGTGEPYPH